MEFFDELKKHVPEREWQMLGQPKFFGIKNAKVHAPVRPGSGWELRGMLRDAITMGNLEAGGVVPKVLCEDSPAAKARKTGMGRMLDACKQLAAAKALTTAVVTPDWPRSSVLVAAGGAEPVLVARISAAGQPLVESAGCSAIFGVGSGELERAFVAARSA